MPALPASAARAGPVPGSGRGAGTGADVASAADAGSGGGGAVFAHASCLGWIAPSRRPAARRLRFAASCTPSPTNRSDNPPARSKKARERSTAGMLPGYAIRTREEERLDAPRGDPRRSPRGLADRPRDPAEAERSHAVDPVGQTLPHVRRRLGVRRERCGGCRIQAAVRDRVFIVRSRGDALAHVDPTRVAEVVVLQQGTPPRRPRRSWGSAVAGGPEPDGSLARRPTPATAAFADRMRAENHRRGRRCAST